MDADSDYEPSDDEGENASVLKGTLCTEIREAKGTAEEKLDTVEKKWQVLTEDQWGNFTDEQAVFDFIDKEVKEAFASHEAENIEQIEVDTKTEDEKFLQM